MKADLDQNCPAVSAPGIGSERIYAALLLRAARNTNCTISFTNGVWKSGDIASPSWVNGNDFAQELNRIHAPASLLGN
jgi:hypothetical protein